MKLSAVVLAAFASLAAAAPQQSTNVIYRALARREMVDYTALVADPCKSTCASINEFFAAWEAKDCNKDTTDDCNKLACSVSRVVR